MKLKNALVYGSDFRFSQGELNWEGERITTASGDSLCVDAGGCYVVPGLIDLHFHGCMGHDFCEGTPAATRTIARYEAQNGVTGICPATMTLPEETLLQIAVNAADFAAAKEQSCALLQGLHLEGPFLSHRKKGAQNGDYLREADLSLFHRLQQAAGGLVKIVSIAPEIPGAFDFIEKARDEVVLSLAHTAADYATAHKALEGGITHATHLYNAMTPFSHREPGAVGAVWEDTRCRAELICDGVHLHPAAVRLSFRILGEDRIILISDSMEATGMMDGEYQLGGQRVTVQGKRATLADGTIAGSATNLMNCMRTAVLEMGIPLESAVRCATYNPARELGIGEECGSLLPGLRADFVLLEPQTLRTRAVWLGGECIAEY